MLIFFVLTWLKIERWVYFLREKPRKYLIIYKECMCTSTSHACGLFVCIIYDFLLDFRFSARTIWHFLYVRGRKCVRSRSSTTDHLSPTALVHTAPPRHSRPVTAKPSTTTITTNPMHYDKKFMRIRLRAENRECRYSPSISFFSLYGFST